MSAVLPADPAEARVFNAAAMELGAVVCTARSPRCDACPIAAQCAWRAAGYPAYDGPRRSVQKRYEGSDRHVRGLIMRELRAAHAPVTDAELAGLWHDPVQLERALAGLLTDGLAVREGAGYVLPS
jgi:A/G-specific adenine glycosylase